MAKEAERLLAGTGCLPEPLRTLDESAVQTDSGAASEPLPAFLVDSEEDSADDQAPSDPEEAPSSAIAAE